MSRKYFLSLDYMETLFLKSFNYGSRGLLNNYDLIYSFTIYPVNKFMEDTCLGCGMRFNITWYLFNLSYDKILSNTPFTSEFMSYNGVTFLICNYLALTDQEIKLFYLDLFTIMNKINVT